MSEQIMDRRRTRKRVGGLGDRVNHISHFDVNVSDLERSREFYESTMPLVATARISARQDFPGLGIEGGHFEGYVLRNATQLGDYPAFHLIEWKNPRPVGRPYRSHGNVGWYRIVPVVRDLDEARRRVVALGSEPFCPTTEAENRMWGPTVPSSVYRVFTAPDPDGIAIEWGYDWPRGRLETSSADKGARTAEPWLADEPPLRDRVLTVAANTTDVDRNIAFYTDVLGLDVLSAMQAPEPIPNVYSAGGGSTQCDGAFFVPRGDRRFFIDWLRWTDSRENDTPYAEPNHLGIARCVLEVDDIDAAYAALLESRAQGADIRGLTAPETWDLGPDVGVRRVLGLTDPDGVAFQLMEEPPYPLSALHPWGPTTF